MIMWLLIRLWAGKLGGGCGREGGKHICKAKNAILLET